jgi:hypothetical protein
VCLGNTFEHDLFTIAWQPACFWCGRPRQRGLAARFLHYDARQLSGVGETFDTVLKHPGHDHQPRRHPGSTRPPDPHLTRSIMPTLTAEIATDRASRFLRQFCQHATAMGGDRGHTARLPRHGGPPADVTLTAECTDTQGVVTFAPWGTCTLTADPATLTVHIDGVDQAALDRIRDIVTRDFDRFSTRNPLTIRWRPDRHSGRRSWLMVTAIAVAVAVAVAVHAGLVGAAIHSGWSLTALAAVAVALVVKTAAMLLVRRRGHRIGQLHHGRGPTRSTH